MINLMKKFVFNIFSLLILVLGLSIGQIGINLNLDNDENSFKTYDNNQSDIDQLLVGLNQSFYVDPNTKTLYQNDYDLTLLASPDNSNNWVEKDLNSNLFMQDFSYNIDTITYDLNFELDTKNNWNTNFYLRADDYLFITYFTSKSDYDYLYFKLPEEISTVEIADFGYVNNQFIVLFANGDFTLGESFFEYDQDNSLYSDFKYLNAGKMIDLVMTDTYLFALSDQGAIYQYGVDIFNVLSFESNLDQPLIVYSYDQNLDQGYYYTYKSNRNQAQNISLINGYALELSIEVDSNSSSDNNLIIKTDRNFYQIYYYRNYFITVDQFFNEDNYNVNSYSIKENHFNDSKLYAINTLNPDNYLYITSINDFSEISLQIIDFNLLTDIKNTSIDGYSSPIYQKEIINFAETESPDVYLIKTNDDLEYLIKLIIEDQNIIYYEVTTYNWIDKLEESNFSGKIRLVSQNQTSVEFEVVDTKINSDRSLEDANFAIKINNVLVDDSYYTLKFEGIYYDQNNTLSYHFKVNFGLASSNSLIYFDQVEMYNQSNQLISKNTNYMSYTEMQSAIIKQNNSFEIIENSQDDSDTSFYFTISFLVTGDYNFANDDVVSLNALEDVNGVTKNVNLDTTYVKSIQNVDSQTPFGEVNKTYEYEVNNLDEEAVYSNFNLIVSQPNVIGDVQTETFALNTSAQFISGGNSAFPITAYILLVVFILLFVVIFAFYYLNYVYNKKSAEKIEYTFENWNNLSDLEINKNDKTIKTEEYNPGTIHRKNDHDQDIKQKNNKN
ncbi:MAG: hypothetical protein HPPSJP_2280 [Candidatus Hepatoplasma scabrum]|nr:MAG: hypothetical protein HPPSJP_2280 [Candidatus Hepatoplasma sp.]